MTRALILTVLLAAPLAANAQSHEGIYSVAGSEPGRGAYTGRVELRLDANGYAFVREVEYSAWTYQGHPVSVVWSGRARDLNGGVEVTLLLDRMGWVSAAPNLPPRTVADGVPMTVVGTFAPAGGGLSGSYRGQGPPFLDPTEQWIRTSPPGSRPIWESERTTQPSHRPPSAREKQILFTLFSSFHTVAWVTPYIPRPDFQAAVHSFTYDRTDFALHRSRPDLLRVINKLVDPLNLEEAKVKTSAFGQTLRTKAQAADLEIPQRFTDPSGAVARRTANGFASDGDGALWTGVYGYTQSLRYQATGEQAAWDNMVRTVRALLTHMEITGRPDEFARTLMAHSGGSLPSNWVAGQGRFAGTAWRQGGNNDMFKGLLWGGLTAHEGLPAGHPMRADYARALGAMIPVHDVMKGFRRAPNRMMAYGLVSLLGNDRRAEREYKKLARNPFYMLFNLALGGGFHYQGITDWSGTHLEVSGQITTIRLADHHNERVVAFINRLALRRGAQRLAPTRRLMHVIAAGGLGVPFFRPFDASDGVWGLREMPFPRTHLNHHHALRSDYGISPYPNLPWKNDWRVDRGRTQGIVAPALFELNLGNYVWKNNPLDGPLPGGNRQEHNSVDYLFAYWLARAHGVIGPND